MLYAFECVQLWRYLATYPSDSRTVKGAVFTAWLVNSAATFGLFAGMYLVRFLVLVRHRIISEPCSPGNSYSLCVRSVEGSLKRVSLTSVLRQTDNQGTSRSRVL